MKNLNRREFLQKSAAAAAVFAATPGVTYAQSVGGGAPFGDYRALVCVFLYGGNDSFNMLVPRSEPEYSIYADARQSLAVPQEQLLPITPLTPDNAQYGLHFAMPGIKSLFDNGQAAFVANVGPLIRPTTKEEIYSGAATLPPQLFSHNDQQDQWLSLKGRAQSKTGWAGRMADLIRNSVAGQQMATNASLFGSNTFQAADETVAYVMGPGGPQPFEGLDFSPEQRAAFLRIVDAEHDSVYERAFAAVQRRAIDSADTVSAAISSAEAEAMIPYFPPAQDPRRTQLMTQMETVAKLIAARDQLQMDRQIFFVAAGGFDTHDDQTALQPGLLGDVSDAITTFFTAIDQELDLSDSVTTFTQSDFGRTLTSNGDGTDHAWGGNQLVVGGVNSLRGQDIYGTYPLLQIDESNPDDIGGGRMIPSTSADQFAATLARWFGIPDVDLDIVAPHIDNFMQRDLGFMV